MLKPLSEYWNAKPGKKRARCKDCVRKENKEWEIKNPDKAKAAKDKFKNSNPDYYRNYQKNWDKENADKRKEYYRRHRESGKRLEFERKNNSRPEVREQRKLRCKKRFETESKYRWMRRIRDLVTTAVRAKNNWFIQELGISTLDFQKYIETTWTQNMNWENHGVHGWHVDHILPLKSFDLDIIEQRYEAAHYTNCRALWAIDNLQKGAKV